MRDYKLNTYTWDLELDENGQQIIIKDLEAVRQRLRIKLQHIQGEFFADKTTGILPLSFFGEKDPDLRTIEAYIKTEIQKDPEVKKVQRINAKFDNMTRIIYIEFAASTIYGDLEYKGEI